MDAEPLAPELAAILELAVTPAKVGNGRLYQCRFCHCYWNLDERHTPDCVVPPAAAAWARVKETHGPRE